MPRLRSRRGFSLIEIMIVVTVILVITTIAIPLIDQQRVMANETAAVRMVQTIHTAQAQYYVQFGVYAGSLEALGPPGAAASGRNAAGLIPGRLAQGVHTGFRFTVTGGGHGYALTAVPVQYPKSGRRSFYSDETGVLRENWGADPASASSPEAQPGR